MHNPPMPPPNFLWSILTMQCPRCRRGDMFKSKSSYSSLKADKILEMYDDCPHCMQKFELETGFWYGTGYVSYALTVALSVATFIAWWVLIGFSINDSRIFYWLGFNILLIFILQPWLMRISRVIYLYFFVKYDINYKQNSPKIFDY